MREATFIPVKWVDLGLSLGLYMPTLNVINSTKGDANSYLQMTLEKWLEKVDKVTGTTWDDLIRAVRSTGDNAAADRIPGILKARNIVETQNVEKGNAMPPINNYTQSYMHYL